MNLNSCWQTDMKSFPAYSCYYFSSTIHMYMLIRLTDFSKLFGQSLLAAIFLILPCFLWYTKHIILSISYNLFYWLFSVIWNCQKKIKINFYLKLMIIHNFGLQHLILLIFKQRSLCLSTLHSICLVTSHWSGGSVSFSAWSAASFIYTYHSNWFSVSSAVWISWH